MEASPPQGLTPALQASFLCSLALAFLRAGRLSVASYVVSSLPASPPARLIPALASSGLAAAAVRFRPVPGDTLTLNSIILSYCSLRSLRPALSLLRSSSGAQAQVASDTVSYNIFLAGLSEQGHGRLAPPVLAEMCKRGVPWDGVTVSTALVGLCRTGLVSEAEALAEMLLRGRGIDGLDVVGWNALIDGHGKVQDMAAALVVVERMRTQGVALDVVGYNTLVAGFCHSGDADAALEVVERMKADGVEPNVVTYMTLIGEYCKRKGIEEAFSLYEGMVRSGVLPDVVTLSALVDGLCRDGQFSEAYALFREMDKIGVAPNHVTYCTLIDSLAKARRGNESLGLLGEMVSRGVVMDLVMYTALMDRLGKEGKIEEAKDVLWHAQSDNLLPTV